MAISFSEGFKDLQLADLSKVVYFKRYFFVPTFDIQVSHFVHMAIIAALVCIAGKSYMLLDMPTSSIWSLLLVLANF